MAHRLNRLLRPESIAIVGISERAGNLALLTWRQLSGTGYEGELFAVNPGYEHVLDRRVIPPWRHYR